MRIPNWLSQVGITGLVRAYLIAAGILGSLMLTWTISIEERGEYYLIIASLGLAAQIAAFGLPSSNTYFFHVRPDFRGTLYPNSLACALLFGVLSAIAAVFYVAPRLNYVPVYVMAIFLICAVPSRVLEMLSQGLITARENFPLFNLNTFTFSALQVLGIAACWQFNASIEVFFGVSAVILMLSCIHLAKSLVPDSTALSVSLFKDSFSYAFRAFVVGSLGFLFTRLGVFLIAEFDTPQSLGVFSVSNQLAEMMLVVPQTLALILFPRILRLKSGYFSSEVMLSIMIVLLVFGLVGLVFTFFGTYLVSISFGESYSSSAMIFVWMLPGVFFLSVATIFSQRFAAAGMPYFLIFVWLIACSLYVLTFVLTFEKLGVLSVGLGYGLSGLYLMVSLIYFSYLARRD